MSFAILPAIDLAGGRLAASAPSGPRPIDAFGGDPVAAAVAFAGAGARWLHVVDMDLAFGGAPGNLGSLTAIRRALPDVRLQASGGIRTWDEAEAFLGAGADRFVLGSAALGDEEAVADILARSGDRVIVGIEVEDGVIRPRGEAREDGAVRQGLDLMATLGWLTLAGAPAFLITAVARVGGLEGPDTTLIRRAIEVLRAGRQIFAAGGVRTVADLEALRDAGAAGAVVGRAALEGELDLAGALAWAAA